MNADPVADETCAACGMAARREQAFCRIYEGERTVTLCCPACAGEYLLASHVNGCGRLADDLVGQFLAEWTWRELGR